MGRQVCLVMGLEHPVTLRSVLVRDPVGFLGRCPKGDETNRTLLSSHGKSAPVVVYFRREFKISRAALPRRAAALARLDP